MLRVTAQLTSLQWAAFAPQPALRQTRKALSPPCSAMKLLVWNINALVGQRVAAIVRSPLRCPMPPPPRRWRHPPPPALPATPPQAPTARNAVHKYGSWAGFFQHHSLDLLALQVRHTCWSMGRQAAQAAASSGHPRCLQLPATNSPCQPLPLQESKVIDEKLTKELACVDGFQSFWACSRCTGEVPRLLTHASSASVRWHACIQG